MKEKRGLSDVVSNILIILLTISAVVIVGNVVVPFVNRSLESTSCFDFRDHFKFDDEFGYNCRESVNDRYVISVKINAENTDKIEGFSLRFLGGDKSETVTIKEGISLTNVKMFDDIGSGMLEVPGAAYSSLTYNYSSNIEYDKVEIYPIISEDKLCDQSDSMRLIKC